MHRLMLAAGFCIVILIFSVTVPAEIIIIHRGAPAEVKIRVGAEGAVTTVIHDVPLSLNGDGTPISGVPAGVIIEVSARRATAPEMNKVYYVVTADSSAPLSTGLDTIPFTEISWTSQDSDIPAGRFDGTSSQVILGPTKAKRMIRDFLTFAYDNDQAVAAGTYTGSVTYTISIP